MGRDPLFTLEVLVAVPKGNIPPVIAEDAAAEDNPSFETSLSTLLFDSDALVKESAKMLQIKHKKNL